MVAFFAEVQIEAELDSRYARVVVMVARIGRVTFFDWRSDDIICFIEKFIGYLFTA